ncbi:hypothetical protein R3P38DRAFT_2770252 [Favolaschia claudopus]|uniref:Uncharacterized protein n=1 Tax=Favolaschia claudopus TaxID=2862362 RepID=A0AAW0CHE0_9AGAR
MHLFLTALLLQFWPADAAYLLRLFLVFEQRLTSGLYDELVQNLQAMGKLALGNVDCPDDFARHQPQYSNNIEFRASSGFEFRTMIVGEVAGSTQGTVLRATGNYFTGDPVIFFSFQPIDDSKKSVKDILALVTPTSASNRLANFFQNQTVPLRDAIDQEIELESRAVPFQEYVLRPWMRSLQENSDQDDIIMVHMAPKYGVPASVGSAVSTPRRGKRKLDEVVSRPALTQPSAVTSVASDSEVPKPDASQIRVGAFYDPRLLCDYGGEYFRQVKARLIQLDVRDATSRREGDQEDPLVPPWEFYERLRPGTLVLVDASLHVFVMNDTDSKGAIRPKKRKIYQINAHSIKILANSDFPVEERKILIPRGFEGNSAAVASPPPQEFSSFSLRTTSTFRPAPPTSSPAAPYSAIEVDEVPESDQSKKKVRSGGKRTASAGSALSG